jgi:peptide/nickel transport system permease protein
MLRLIGRRLLAVIPVMFVVSVATFILTYLVPGDPAVTLAGQNPTPQTIAAIRAQLGLNRPVVVQYGHWIWAALHGNLGRSLFTAESVTSALGNRVPVTLSLALGALVVAIIIGVPAGLIAGANHREVPDRAVNIGAALGMATPSYFVGALLIIAFSLHNHLLPPTGYSALSSGVGPWIKHLILPSIALGLALAAVLARQLRAGLITALNQDYVRTARAKGLGRWAVLLKHALKNAAIPPLTAVATGFAVLVGGTAVVEQVFAIPGLGNLAVNAVQQRDIPILQGVVLITALLVQAINILVDVLYGFLNPRVRVA